MAQAGPKMEILRGCHSYISKYRLTKFSKEKIVEIVGVVKLEQTWSVDVGYVIQIKNQISGGNGDEREHKHAMWVGPRDIYPCHYNKEGR